MCEIYSSPKTKSSYDATMAWLHAVLSMKTPFSPSAMFALVEAMHQDVSPDEVVKLAHACEEVADVAHDVAWSPYPGEEIVPDRKEIKISASCRYLAWESSVSTRLVWGESRNGETWWQVEIIGDHYIRQGAVEQYVANWNPADILDDE